MVGSFIKGKAEAFYTLDGKQYFKHLIRILVVVIIAARFTARTDQALLFIKADSIP